ncbi:MAG: ABC transporter permease subunit [Halobacteriota archaeon]|uniref:ABC transporter permease subunit n=1 Tax=Natronomonas sp. TaxID=2184060 RepID=UPI003975D935
MSRLRGFGPVAWRELVTVARTRSYLLLSAGLLAVFAGVLRAGGGIDGGYIPAAVDLLLPLELLVPLVAVALGYRAFSGDNDDRSVLRTYPISKPSLVGGIFVGRLVGLAGIVGGPLAGVGVVLSVVGGPQSRVFAVHRGVDSPILFVRFIALTIGFGAVVLAMTMAAAVIVRTGRAALAAALAVLVGVVVGGDLLVLAGLTTDSIGGDLLGTALAVSPNGAYRGLVLESVVGVATDRGSAIDVTAAVVGLVGWLAVSLGIIVAGIDRHAGVWLRDVFHGTVGWIADAVSR